MASAQQYAPEKQYTENRQGTVSAEKKQKAVRRSIPQAAGIVLMIIMIALAVPAGNFRALQGAMPASFYSSDVKSIVEDRIEDAGNALTVAKRANLSDDIYADVESAVAEVKAAKTARQLSRADQKLTAAVSRMSVSASDVLDSENSKMLQRAVDDFTEQGSFLRQEGKSFNEKAEKAKKLYEKLPAKAILSEPDSFEGV